MQPLFKPLVVESSGYFYSISLHSWPKQRWFDDPERENPGPRLKRDPCWKLCGPSVIPFVIEIYIWGPPGKLWIPLLLGLGKPDTTTSRLHPD